MTKLTYNAALIERSGVAKYLVEVTIFPRLYSDWLTCVPGSGRSGELWHNDTTPRHNKIALGHTHKLQSHVEQRPGQHCVSSDLSPRH